MKEQERNQWIGVTERLPEQDGEYLTYTANIDAITVLYYQFADRTWGYLASEHKQPDYWMPLPASPKSEGG